MDNEHLERLARLEQSVLDHITTADERLDNNDRDHAIIIEKLTRIDRDIAVYRWIVYTVGCIFGTIIWWAWEARDWIINRLGH